MRLVFDTTSSLCSVALFNGRELLAFKSEVINRGHAEFIFPFIENVLENANVKINQIKELGLTVGPGSFTGVRVGVSVAKGLAYGLNIPIKTMTALEAVAHTANIENRFSQNAQGIVLINAKKGQVYLQNFIFNKDSKLVISNGNPEILAIEGIEQKIDPTLDVIIASPSLNIPHLISPDNTHIIETFAKAHVFGQEIGKVKSNATLSLSPLYIRPPDAIKMSPQLGLEI